MPSIRETIFIAPSLPAACHQALHHTQFHLNAMHIHASIIFYRPSWVNDHPAISLPIEWVQNTSIAQNGIGRLLQIGDLRVQTAGGRGEIFFPRVFRPKQVQDKIWIAMRKAQGV